MISQALEGAYKLLSEPQTLSLSPEEQMHFFHLLENPPALNATLSRAIERYKKIKGNGSEV